MAVVVQIAAVVRFVCDSGGVVFIEDLSALRPVQPVARDLALAL